MDNTVAVAVMLLVALVSFNLGMIVGAPYYETWSEMMQNTTLNGWSP